MGAINESYESSYLTIRFRGEGYEERGAWIYDLGNVLISLQKILHKIYLIENERFSKKAVPKKHEREMLSMQIGERRSNSDAFGLIPIVADNNNLNILYEVVKTSFAALSEYYLKDIIDRVGSRGSEKEKMIIGAIYADTVNVVDRVGSTGGADRIEIGAPAIPNAGSISFDESHKDYCREIKEEFTLGEYTSIVGIVYRLYPISDIVTIKRESDTNVNIHLVNPDHFERIRYSPSDASAIRFYGRPRIRFGLNTGYIEEFEAYEIEFI